MLPPASSTVTTGWLVQATPLAPPLGWVVTTRWVAAPTVTVKLVGELAELVPSETVTV